MSVQRSGLRTSRILRDKGRADEVAEVLVQPPFFDCATKCSMEMAREELGEDYPLRFVGLRASAAPARLWRPLLGFRQSVNVIAFSLENGNFSG